MPCVFSASVSSRALPALLHHLARTYHADLLLCGPLAPAAAPRTERSIAGIAPVRELELHTDTPREHLHDFCFTPCATAVSGTIGYLNYTGGLARYDIRSDKSENGQDGRPEEWPDKWSDNVSDNWPDDRSDVRPDDRPENSPNGRSDQKPENRPEDTPESKPADRQKDLPEGLFRQYAIQLIISPAQEPCSPPHSVDGTAGTDTGSHTARHDSRHDSGHNDDHDKGHGKEHSLECHTAEILPDSLCGKQSAALIDELKALCTGVIPPDPIPAHVAPLSRDALSRRLRQSLDRKGYVRRVERVLEHIRDGDTYQLNLSTRFDADLSGTGFDPLTFFMHMWDQHPAPFYAWLSHGSTRIISTSPERFLCVRDGQVLSQPIKGTLEFESFTEGMEKALTASPKESAELSMIVDLIRNDIAACCEYGSVQVSAHKETFTVDRLIQMYSDVRGTLRSGSTCLDLLLDAFPGGSVTGCPKQRTMRIIEKEEPHSRGLYCGSVVFIEDPQNMDSSIAIRTGWYDSITKALCFFSGSGIVLDSNPESEYRETLAKAGKFLRALAP